MERELTKNTGGVYRWRSGIAVDRSHGCAPSRPDPRPARNADRAECGLDHHVIEILDTFAVCYATFDDTGRRTYLSPAAETLLENHPHPDGLLGQARDLAQRAIAEVAQPRSLGGCSRGEPPMRVPAGSRGALLLHVRLMRPRSGSRVAVVTLQPGPHTLSVRPPSEAGGGLTERETQVAHLLAAGKSTKQVAAALAISPHTARHHTERVYTKLGLRSRVALALALASR